MMVQTVRLEDRGVEIRNGYLFRNDGSPLEVVEVLDGPFVASLETPPASIEKDPLVDDNLRYFKFVIKTKRGEETVEGEIKHSISTTYLSPNDELLGTAFAQLGKGQPRASQLTESSAIFSWNGIKGVGNRERIVRLSVLK
jgi:hypothetical protein